MIDLLTEPLREGITQRALVELLILGVVCGPLGLWVVLYRQSYAAESLAHSMLPGLVVATLISIPLGLGAAAGLAVAAISIAAASRQHAVSPDVAVAVTVTALFGAGTLLALSPEVPVRLGELLFGDPLSVTTTDLLATAALALVTLIALAYGHRTLTLSGFDPQTAHSLGGSNGRAGALLLGLLALTVLIAVQALGNLLVVAIVIAPGAAALRHCRSLVGAAAVAAAVAVAAGVAGIYLSYWANLAAGASIALCAVALFALVMVIPRSRSAGPVRRQRGRVDRAGRLPASPATDAGRASPAPVAEPAESVHPVPGGLRRGGHHRDPEPVRERIGRRASPDRDLGGHVPLAVLERKPGEDGAVGGADLRLADHLGSPGESGRERRLRGDRAGVGCMDDGGPGEAGELAGKLTRLHPEDRVLAAAPAPQRAGPVERERGPAHPAEDEVDGRRGDERSRIGPIPTRRETDLAAERSALGPTVVVAAAVVVVLPGGRDVLVVEMGAAVRLGEHVGAVRIAAAAGEEPAGDHAAELASEPGEELERGAVDRADGRADRGRGRRSARSSPRAPRSPPADARDERPGSGPRSARGSPRPRRARGGAAPRRP